VRGKSGINMGFRVTDGVENAKAQRFIVVNISLSGGLNETVGTKWNFAFFAGG
jgi:hypothetical protein